MTPNNKPVLDRFVETAAQMRLCGGEERSPLTKSGYEPSALELAMEKAIQTGSREGQQTIMNFIRAAQDVRQAMED